MGTEGESCRANEQLLALMGEQVEATRGGCQSGSKGIDYGATAG